MQVLIEEKNSEYAPVLPKIMDVIVTRIDSALDTMSHASANSGLYNRAMITKQQAQSMRDQVSQGAIRR